MNLQNQIVSAINTTLRNPIYQTLQLVLTHINHFNENPTNKWANKGRGENDNCKIFYGMGKKKEENMGCHCHPTPSPPSLGYKKPMNVYLDFISKSA